MGCAHKNRPVDPLQRDLAGEIQRTALAGVTRSCRFSWVCISRARTFMTCVLLRAEACSRSSSPALMEPDRQVPVTTTRHLFDEYPVDVQAKLRFGRAWGQSRNCRSRIDRS